MVKHSATHLTRVPAMRLPASALATLLVALLALLAVGCGDDSESANGDRRPLVTFGRTSDDGRTFGLVVERGGGATLTRYPDENKTFTVDGDKRSDLQSALEKLDVQSLESGYEPSPPTAEGSRYSVTYEGTTITAAEKADMPDSLRSVIEMLNGLLDDET